SAIAVGRGVQVRRPGALERARRMQVVVFDKTGTLTEGELEITDILPTAGITQDELLRLAAAVERKSPHPTARAIVGEAGARKLRRGRPSRFTPLNSRGVTATIEQRDITVASVRVVIERGLILDAALVRAAQD